VPCTVGIPSGVRVTSVAQNFVRRHYEGLLRCACCMSRNNQYPWETQLLRWCYLRQVSSSKLKGQNRRANIVNIYCVKTRMPFSYRKISTSYICNRTIISPSLSDTSMWYFHQDKKHPTQFLLQLVSLMLNWLSVTEMYKI
jgi:hypothetical protein